MLKQLTALILLLEIEPKTILNRRDFCQKTK